MRQIELMALSKGNRVREVVSQVCGTVVEKQNNAAGVLFDDGRTKWCGAGDIEAAPKDDAGAPIQPQDDDRFDVLGAEFAAGFGDGDGIEDLAHAAADFMRHAFGCNLSAAGALLLRCSEKFPPREGCAHSLTCKDGVLRLTLAIGPDFVHFDIQDGDDSEPLEAIVDMIGALIPATHKASVS